MKKIKKNLTFKWISPNIFHSLTQPQHSPKNSPSSSFALADHPHFLILACHPNRDLVRSMHIIISQDPIPQHEPPRPPPLPIIHPLVQNPPTTASSASLSSTAAASTRSPLLDRLIGFGRTWQYRRDRRRQGRCSRAGLLTRFSLDLD